MYRLKNLSFCLLLFCSCIAYAQKERAVWTVQKANNWYADKGWLRGCDFIPSSAINQLEMWQAETFDSARIKKELGFAEGIGMNCMRVFLHHLAWQQDKAGFKQRMNTYLRIAADHHIVTMFVFFDDCWNESYKAGTQPLPKPGVHNSGWVRDPGKLFYDDPATEHLLEDYVKDILTAFKDDKRILLWDLYNEPGNSGYKNKSLPLLQKIFQWGRQVNPSQPLSAGVWNQELHDLNAFQLSQSDVITYHNYEDEKAHQQCIDTLKKYNRPLLCTEYMARLRHSTFYNIMPILKAQRIAAINWGLTAGKKYGRKKVLMVIAVMYIFAAIGCASISAWILFILFRFIGGIAVGASSVVGPMYISEIAPPKLRGRLAASFQLNIVTGIFVAYLTNFLFKDIGEDAWRWMLGIMVIPAAAFWMLLRTIPESPR